MLKHNHSFTLTEVLVAVTIIIILAGILIGGVSAAARRGDEAKTISALEQLSAGLEQFRSERGYYPIAKDGYIDVKLKLNSSGNLLFVTGREYDFFNADTKKPYCEFPEVNSGTAVEIVDAWGNAIQYKCPGNHNKQGFDLWSKGADGEADDGDDDKNADNINNWGQR